MKLNVIEFESIPSTNQYLKENYQTLPNYSLCVSAKQTKGRGRMNRVWQDSEGSALFSLLIKDNIDDVTFIPLIAAYCVSRVLSKYVDGIKVKWPNDIILNSKKLAGILVEGITTDKIEAIIIGIGINVNNKDFDTEISQIATSLYLEGNNYSSIKEIISLISHEIIETIECCDKAKIVSMLNQKLWIKDKVVSFVYKNETLSGKVEKINEDGSLKINCDGRAVRVVSGEVTLHDIYK